MRTNRLLYLIGMMVLVFAIATPVAAISGTGFAQEGPSVPNWPDDGLQHLFLPFMVRNFSFQLTGQIKDAEDLPLSGVTVTSDMGRMSVTDANGVYQMTTFEGSQKVAVAKSGYNFEPATAQLNVTSDMKNLNFSALSVNAPSVAACESTLLTNSDFEGGLAPWIVRDEHLNGKNKSRLVDWAWKSPTHSILSGAEVGIPNPWPNEWTTGEFYQTTNAVIPSDATEVQLQVHLLPRSTDLWGYHIAEQKAMDVASGPSFPDATEAQYGFVCTDGSDTETCEPSNGGKMLFKWFPIDSYWWLFRSYDLRAYRGDTISVLFGAANDGYNGNTALFVDNVYLYYCVP